MTLTLTEIEILRDLTYDFLKNIIQYFPRLKNEVGTLGEPLLEPFRTSLIITQGTPEEGSYGTAYHNNFAYSASFVRKAFQLLNSEKKMQKNFDKLDELGLFKHNSHNLANPSYTIYGFLIQRCIEELTFTSEENYEKDLKIELDHNTIDRVFDELIGFYTKEETEIEFIYVIWGISFEGNDFVFDNIHDKGFFIPSNEKRETLSKLMRFRYSEWTGQYGLTQKMTWITSCNAWIHGNICMNNPKFPEKPRSIEDYFLQNVDLFPPDILEEAFHLLGYDQTEVKFFSITNENSFSDYTLRPTYRGVQWLGGFRGGIQYPDWMEERIFSYPMERKPFELNDLNIHFIKMYPAFRLKMEPNSFESMILNRFSRLRAFKDAADTILESCIILESIVTDEAKELGFQLRIKVGWLITKDIDERKIIAEIIKRLYSIRSDIVHNGGQNLIKKAKKLGGVNQASFFAKELARLVLLRLIYQRANIIEILKRDELKQKLTDLMFGEKLNLANSVYFDEFAPEVIKTIKQKYLKL